MNVNPTAVHYSTVIGALTGVVLWVLQTYAFPKGVPGPLEAAAVILIPAACSGVASLLTRRADAQAQAPASPPSPPAPAVKP